MENTRTHPGNWRTRIAPTPSGFLHLGNVYSFSLTSAFAHVLGADTMLRIDDLDSVRTREAYIEDIFETLSFLDIPWQAGPRNSTEFNVSFSQKYRKQLYDRALQKLAGTGKIYACTCSRSALAAHNSNGYPGTCRDKNIPLDAEGACWRVITSADAALSLRTPAGYTKTRLPDEMRDFVVRKKDGAAAYQLSSVIDDVFYGINLVIRGDDLMFSTLAQLHLAHLLGFSDFSETVFYHHRLLLSGSGDKLSKTAGDTSVHFLRKHGAGPRQVYEAVGKMCGNRSLAHWRDLCDEVSQLFSNTNNGEYGRL